MTKPDHLALDRATVRTKDEDGRLKVAVTNISKANICPYMGKEIPDYQKLGLEPDKIYQLLRDPEELKKAAPSFNGIPLLSEHVPVSADDHKPELVVGATGTDAEFKAPYLRNSLVVWASDAIDGIESGEQKELSSAYRYEADMTPGTYQGAEYDGVMRNIRGNHVALVPVGRAGADVVVGDSQLETIYMPKPLSAKALLAKGALQAVIRPKLAQDAKIDFTHLVRGITAANWASRKPGILNAIKPKLASDASLEDITKLLDSLDGENPEEPKAGAEDDDDMSDIPAVDGDEEDAAKPIKKPEAEDDGEHSEADEEAIWRKLHEMIGKMLKDEPAAKPPAQDAEEDDEDEKKEKPGVTKAAMDAALASVARKTARDTEANVMARMRAIHEAEKAVAPHVGELAYAMDSADDVYRFCLESKGIDLEGVPPAGFKAMVGMLTTQAAAAPRQLAQDAAGATGAAKRFPNAKRPIAL